MEALRYQSTEITREELENLRQRIIQNIRNSGEYTSGRTAQSMAVEVSDTPEGTNGTLWGRSFFGTLETGSKPWSTQYIRPPKFFVDLIAEWARTKGIDAPAGGIAHNIMTKGSKLYRDGGRVDIYSNEIPKTIDNIGRRLMGLFSTAIDESIKINSQP